MINTPHDRVNVRVVLISFLTKYCAFSVGFKEGMGRKNGIGYFPHLRSKCGVKCQSE